MRYVIRRLTCDEDVNDEEGNSTPHQPMPVVFDRVPEFINTGILTADGNEIYRHVGMLPIGFLAEHPDE